MRRQRTKDELLNRIRANEAIKKDMERPAEDRIHGGISYWRANVEISYILWKNYNFYAKSIVNFINYMNEQFCTMDEARRKQIRDKLKGSDWILKNRVVKRKYKNSYDQMWNSLEYYNTEVSVDITLLAAEWLLEHKKFDIKKIDDFLENLYVLDSVNAETVFKLRQQIFESKGIWISLNEKDKDMFELDPEQKMEVI